MILRKLIDTLLEKRKYILKEFFSNETLEIPSYIEIFNIARN